MTIRDSLSVLRSTHWSLCMFWLILCVIHSLFLLLQHFFALFWFLILVDWWCYRTMVFLLFLLHDRPHELVIFFLFLLGLHGSLNSQFFKIFFLPLFSLLLFALHNIRIKCLSIFSNWKFFVIIHWNLDWIPANYFFLIVVEVFHVSVLKSLSGCVSIVWVK